VICDVDLSGADAQVVAWEANDNDLKDAFRAGLDVHKKNGQDLWGSAYNDDTMRWQAKGVHAINYATSANTLAKAFGMTRNAAQAWIDSWFRLHPGIRDWHRRTERDLQTSRCVRNKFGYRIVYFDRPDNLLPKGLAWIPQSTVAVVCGRGAVQLSKTLPWITVLLQVHDSIVFQVPYHRATTSSFADIRRSLEIPIPYSDPLLIPWGLAISDRSWGEVSKTKWEEVG